MTDLVFAFNSPNPKLRERAILAFDQLDRSTQSVAILTEALKSKHDDVRWHAAYALARIADKRTVKALAECLATDTDCTIRIRAIDALSVLKTKAAISALVKAFSDDSPTVRAAAVVSLTNINSDSAIRGLVKGLMDQESVVFDEAAEALVSIGDRRVVTLLVDEFERGPDIIRGRIAILLRDIGGRQAVAALVRALTGHDEPSRQIVIEVLANRCSQEINMALARALKGKGAEQEKIIWEAVEKIGSRDEVAQLVGKFEELRRTHTLEEQRAFVAHEVKSAIGPLRMVAKKMQDSLRRGELDKRKLSEYTTRIVSDTATAYQVVDQYVNYTRPMIPTLKRTNLKGLLEECVSEVSAQCDDVDIAITVIATSKIDTMVDGALLAQAFRNILQNAIDAIGKDGNIIITLHYEKNRVTITISDTGSGIEGRNLSRVFDLGFTTKQGKQGAGVGLALVRRIVEEGHSGSVEIANNRARNGATVMIALPRPRLPRSSSKGTRHEATEVETANSR